MVSFLDHEGFHAAAGDFVGMNLYAYCDGDPVNKHDSDGRAVTMSGVGDASGVAQIIGLISSSAAETYQVIQGQMIANSTINAPVVQAPFRNDLDMMVARNNLNNRSANLNLGVAAMGGIIQGDVVLQLSNILLRDMEIDEMDRAEYKAKIVAGAMMSDDDEISFGEGVFGAAVAGLNGFGFNGIYEGVVSGQDLFSGDTLSTGERWWRAGTGTLEAGLTIAPGVSAAKNSIFALRAGGTEALMANGGGLYSSIGGKSMPPALFKRIQKAFQRKPGRIMAGLTHEQRE